METDRYIEFKEYLSEEYGASINDCIRNNDGKLCVLFEAELGFERIILPDEYQDIEL